MKNFLPLFILMFFSMQLMSNDIILYHSHKLSEEMTGITEDPYSPFNLPKEDILWVENTLNKMTTYEKCAQMILPWVEAAFLNEEDNKYQRIIHLVKDLKVGGLIFFEGNILNQVLLTNKMQELSDIPLLISSDFERGLGMRLKDATEFPYNMALGAADDLNLTYQMGKTIATEARAIGVHQNYAPTADINNDARNPIINIRAFSEDRDITVRHALAFIMGSHEERVITTAKHFPGHGATSLDSHKELPLLKNSAADFEMNDLVPFKEAIKAGVKSIMVGHLDVPAFEEVRGLPATLSQSIITRLLIDQLGFRGLIITDAMNMNGVAKFFKPDEATVRAVQAGNDMILFPPDEELSINGLYNAVEDGEISLDRINHSVRKILAAKKWLQLDQNKFVNLNHVTQVLGKKSHLRLAQEIADRSITLVKNDKSTIPLDPQKFQRTACLFLSDRKYPVPYLFGDLIKDKFRGVKTTALGRIAKEGEYSKALELAKESDLILVPIFAKIKAFSGSIDLPKKHVSLIEKLNKLNKPVVFLSMGNPYMLSEFPDISTYLCSYGEPDVSQIAMVKAISGETNITGKLPINIPNTEFKIGDGLQIKKNKFNEIDNGERLDYNFTLVDSIMQSGLQQQVFPGAVLLIGHKGNIIYKKAFGKYTYDPASREMNIDAIFDLASVSKVVGTTTAAMILFDEGKIILDQKVSHYLPQFGNKGKENITIRNLLVHNSGLPSWKPFYKTCTKPDEVVNLIMNSDLDYNTGTKTIYSDLGIITLQKIIENISGKPLDEFLKERVFNPLHMDKTMYNPPPQLWYDCVSTEIDNYWRKTELKGKVHDETAYLLGGVAGHAGLFSTGNDLSVFAQMMIQKGKFGDFQIIKPSTIDDWTKRQSGQSSRGLGWDTKSLSGSSAGSLFSTNSFGHTGFTGTSMWFDKDKELFVVLLTNRVYPTRDNTKIIQFRPNIHDAIVKTISY